MTKTWAMGLGRAGILAKAGAVLALGSLVGTNDVHAADARDGLEKAEAASKTRPVAAQAAPAAEDATELLDQGIQLLKTRRYSEACDVLLRCTQVDKAAPRCYMYLGSVYAKLRDSESAARAYRMFVELAPEDPLAPRVREMLQEFEKSRRDGLEKAEATSMTGPVAAQAAPASKEAAELLDKGTELFKTRRYSEARDVLLRCTQVDKTAPRCHMYLGSAYAKLRDLDSAARAYRMFVELAPQDPLAPRVREMLREFEKNK